MALVLFGLAQPARLRVCCHLFSLDLLSNPSAPCPRVNNKNNNSCDSVTPVRMTGSHERMMMNAVENAQINGSAALR